MANTDIANPGADARALRSALRSSIKGHLTRAWLSSSALGDSITWGGDLHNTAPYNLMIWKHAGRFRDMGNFGYPGQGSQYILDTGLPAVIASGADFCFFQGTVNDPQSNIAESVTRANQIAIIQGLLAAGIEPIVGGRHPHNTEKYIWQQVRNDLWLKLWCYKMGIRFISAWERGATPAGKYKATYDLDGLHPSIIYATLEAEDWYKAITTQVLDDVIAAPCLALMDSAACGAQGSISGTTLTVTSIVSGRLYPGMFINDNGAVAGTYIVDYGTGTGGTGTYVVSQSQSTGAGQFNCLDRNNHIANAISFTDTNADGMPDFWAAYGAGGTYSITAPDAGDFGAWLRCAFTAGSRIGFDSNNGQFAPLGWSIGDKIAVGYKIRTNGGVACYTEFNGMTAPVVMNGNQIPAGTTYTVYEERVITAGTSCTLRFNASGTGWFEVSRPIIYNLTRNALADF